MAQSDEDRLKALDARIAAAQAKHAPKPHMEEHYSQAQHAWRMVVELVAGLAIGFGIGYGLDAVLGTTPWLLIIFTLLGFVAGVKTMIRSAHEMQRDALTRSGEQGNGNGQRDDQRRDQ